MFFKIVVLKNSTLVFENSIFLENLVAAFFSFMNLLFRIGHLPTFSSKSKTQCGMVSTEKVCRSVQSMLYY